MKFVSKLFQPVVTIPKNAKIKSTEITCKSQKLLVERGLVRPTGSGLFALMPLARRALDKLEALLCRHVEAAGGQRVSLPALTAAGLWRASGRLAGAGPELMRLTDRQGKELLLAPTHEEAIADLLADVGPLSYRQLPLLLYQITNKYRDEARPKHGLLRAREFLMLDAYGVHAGAEGAGADDGGAGAVYEAMTTAYRNIFKELQIEVVRVAAPSGAMGGRTSHEWHALAGPAGAAGAGVGAAGAVAGAGAEGAGAGAGAAAGEERVHVCAECGAAGLEPACEHDSVEVRSGIEVGHTFLLGARYEALGARYAARGGGFAPVTMSCYGVGVTRLLAACVETLSTADCIRWPDAIAPYRLVIIGAKEGSKSWATHGAEAARALAARAGADVLVDDRHQLSIGRRLLDADRLGLPALALGGAGAELHRGGRGRALRGEDVDRLLETL